MIDLLVTLHEGEVKNYPCGAGLSLFSVDCDGRLYLCQRLTGDTSLCMGDVFEGMDSEKVERFRKEAGTAQREPCANCWARVVCAGGCYHEALVRQGGLTRANLHYCEWIKRWVEIGMETYCRIALNRPACLDELAFLRGCSEPRAHSHESEGV